MLTSINKDPDGGRVPPDARIMFYLNNGRYDVTDTPDNLLKNILGLVSDNEDEGKEGGSSPGSLVLSSSQGGTYVVAFRTWPDLQNYLVRSTKPLPPAPVPAPLPTAATVSDSMLSALWQCDLGVAPTPADLASMRAMANAGCTIGDVRTSIAASAQAISAIGGLTTSLTGSTASAATIQGYERQLMQPDASLATLRATIAHSPDGQAAVDGLYAQVLGRAADPGGEAAWQGHLAEGMSLDDERIAFAASPEAMTAVARVYQGVTGAAASPEAIRALEGQLAQPGQTLDSVRARVALSPDGRAAVDGLYTQVLGRAADPGGEAAWQGHLAEGMSLDDERTAFAASPEAISTIGGLTTSLTGTTASAAAIQGYEKDLLVPGETLADVRSTIAHSTDARAVVSGLYAQELGRAPDAGGLAGWQDYLGTTMTLAQVRAGIANSTEATGDIRNLDLYASGQTPTNAAVASEQATLSQGGSLSGVYSSAVTAAGVGFIGSQDQYKEALRQIRLPAAGIDGPLSTVSTGLRNVLDWAARKAPELGAVGAAAAILLTPTNTQQTTTEVGVAGDPDFGARYTRAPGSLSGTVTLYARGQDGQPVGDGITLQASADGQLTGPAGSPLAGVVFGTLPPGNIFEGVQLAPGLITALGLVPTASGAPQTAPGSGIEVRTQEEADLVASMQAQGKSTADIQSALDALRSGQGGIPISETVDNAIQEAAGSSDQDIQLEGKTAQFIQSSGINVVNFQREIGPNASITELDIETSKTIVEVTNQSAGKLRQITARLNNSQINPENKGVILYAPNYGVAAGRDITNVGGYVARTPQQLIDLLRSLGE